ncbi:MAG: hypothetical protein JWP29_1757 [Rhodoferax sp.]|nr:hypothetical protein [Rhodoferax sp.]
MRPALVVLMLCLVVAVGADASAKKGKPDAVKVVKKHGGKAPKFIKGGEETTAERDRRLLRECKGRVNAGACAGFTG